jgi:hypothetical protein
MRTQTRTYIEARIVSGAVTLTADASVFLGRIRVH